MLSRRGWRRWMRRWPVRRRWCCRCRPLRQYGDTALLLLEVPAGLPHVYSVHGKYLRRAGATNQPIPPDALRKLLIERGETSWERLAPAGATLDDLDPNKLSAYVQRSGPAAAGDPLAFLFRRGCLARD